MREHDILTASLTERWPVRGPTSTSRAGRPPRGDADVVLVGVSADLHLDAVALAVARRGRSISCVHIDVDFAGGLNLVVMPPATTTAHAVLCRPVDLTLPIPHHGLRSFITVDPFDRQDPLSNHAHREVAAATQCWADTLIAEHWINDSWAVRRADSKALQLRVAAGLGLPTPRTMITADVAALSAFVDECGGTVVHKSMRSPLTFLDGEVGGFLHTSVVSAELLGRLGAALPHASMFQERLKSRAEYRVTVVGDCVMSARIDTSTCAEPDWRREVASGRARFDQGRLDSTIEIKLVSLVAELGLVYATIDLIESPDGSIYFLEVNPSGSYLWIESSTGLPITETLTDELVRGLA